MRILQIMHRVPWPLKDGGALGFYNYTKGYHHAGVDVTVCALNTNKHHVNMDTLPQEVKSLADWRTSDIQTDVRVLPAFLNLFSGSSYNIDRFYSVAFEKLIQKTLNEKEFDVVVFEGIFVAPYLALVRLHSKAICVLREHNVEYRIWETLAQNSKQFLKRTYLNLLSRRMKKVELGYLNRFDALTTVTEEDAAQFKKEGCSRPVFVSPFGIDMERLIPNHANLETGSVFHLGSMEWQPNQQAMEWFLQDVWSKVTEAFPLAHLYLAGRGMPDSFNRYKSSSISIVGEVENAVSFMQQKQIMVVPLFAGSGIRVKILEGMALGKAIVSTPLGAQGIAVNNGEHLLLAQNAEEFASAIVSLLRNPQKLQSMQLAAQKLAKDFYDNTKVIERVLSFYNDLRKDK